FHPYNWIGSNQVVELVGHTVSKHGKHIKFLNFREAQERIDKNLLDGQPLRRKDGGDNGVRLLDLNNDGYLDVVIGNDALQQTRLLEPKTSKWRNGGFPVQIGPGTRFGILQNRGLPSVIALTEKRSGLWHFDGTRWVEISGGTAGLELDGEKILAERNG